ncbi:hypothetical protein M3210_14025 [Oceanobacillus luteolus]|uniref:hypothetical protein n=1 Tax=Oceanobacillus luteolus TaxID=1274358 RepID=UPI00203EF37A|nr:hypothetical protein [Oceanobacillus luteolus]MCM3741386.1 hypothetical protein [Oceanobacillus luteolus]
MKNKPGRERKTTEEANLELNKKIGGEDEKNHRMDSPPYSSIYNAAYGVSYVKDEKDEEDQKNMRDEENW